MIFNSLTFLVFLIIVVSLYWVLPKRLRLWLIFLGSLTFYGFWRWEFLSLVLLSTVIDYVISLQLDKTPDEHKIKRKALLLTSLVLNLGLLIYFKYTYFIVDNLNWIFDLFKTGKTIHLTEIILPLGISFYTFQTISYTIDVYRRHAKAEKDFILYGCYVTFFPQLVAGPILRAGEVMNQLAKRPKFKINYIIDGIERILYGFFLKVVLADNIAPLIDEGFALKPEVLGGLDVWTLAFLFGFQIYFDFAGYSHIAIGTAKLMGIDFPENFNFPYAAKSFKSFWKRWHISLSSWIRDYLYLPLSGVKVINPNQKSKGGISVDVPAVSKNKKNTALFLTWSIMGLWHGANWTFVIWGIYHSFMIYVERILKPLREKVSILKKPIVGWAITVPVAMLGWIPFRATSVKTTFIMYEKVLSPASYLSLAMRENTYLVTFLLFLLITVSYVYYTYIKKSIIRKPVLYIPFQIIKYSVVIFLVFTFFRPISQFIYFQF